MAHESGASRRDVLRGAAGVSALMGAIGMSSVISEEDAAAAAAAVGGSVKYFLNLSGVVGESIDAHHPKWIDLVSFSWGASAPVASSSGGGGVTTGKAEAMAMTFHALTSSASPLILRKLVAGTHTQTAILAGHSAAGDFLRVTLKSVLVSSYKPAGSGVGWPVDTFSLVFDEIVVSYRPTLANGTLSSTAISVDWNIATNAVV